VTFGNTSIGTVGTLTNWHASVTDWTDGGRLDLILDARSSHTAANVAALILADPTHLLYTEHTTGYVGLANIAHGGAAASLNFPGGSVFGATTMINAAGIGLSVSGTTYGIKSMASAGEGFYSEGTSYGLHGVASAGVGLQANGTTCGLAGLASNGTGIVGWGAGGNGSGMTLVGNGTGDGLTLTAGATGTGMRGNIIGTLSRVTLADTVTTYTGNTPQTGDSFARLGAPVGASLSVDLAAVKSDSAAILADTGTDGVVVATASKTGYTLTAGPLDAAGVRAALGLAAANLDTQLADIPTVAEFNARSLVSSGYAPAATALSNAMWTDAKAGYLTGAVPTVASVVASVWGEALPGTFGTGTAGKLLSSAGSAADPWVTLLPGSYGAGTAGQLISLTYAKVGSATLTVQSPVATSGAVTIYRGDDYATADGRQLSFTVASYSGPSLAGGATTFALITKANFDRGLDTKALSVAATVTGTTTLTITVDLTAAQTAALAANPNQVYTYVYQIRSTTSAARKVTLAQGNLVVRTKIAE
jgi:hypothetical protein